MKPGALLGEVRAWLQRPRIVHRLPGRLRLNLPLLQRLDPAQREWLSVWRKILDDIPGIRSIELTWATGSVLIRYDPGRLTEPEIVDFLAAVNRVVLRHWQRLAAIPPERLPEAVRQMAAALRAGIRRPLALDENLEITWDV
jgi:hypothetical protein